MRMVSLGLFRAGIITSCLISPASAADVAMTRVLACEGDDAKMEVYLPRSVVTGTGVANANLSTPVVGLYALDLSAAGKGKSLEPARVSYTPDKKMVIVDQFTRGLPPTRIPVGGGTVDFDQRFGTNAKCGPFNDG
jgi:hypothetical protein